MQYVPAILTACTVMWFIGVACDIMHFRSLRRPVIKAADRWLRIRKRIRKFVRKCRPVCPFPPVRN